MSLFDFAWKGAILYNKYAQIPRLMGAEMAKRFCYFLAAENNESWYLTRPDSHSFCAGVYSSTYYYFNKSTTIGILSLPLYLLRKSWIKKQLLSDYESFT